MSAHKIAFAIGLLSLGLLACQGDTIVSPNAGAEGIHVSGQASVSAAPDIVDLLNGAMAEALAESLSWSHAGVTLLSDSRRPIENFDISEVGIGGLR